MHEWLRELSNDTWITSHLAQGHFCEHLILNTSIAYLFISFYSEIYLICLLLDLSLWATSLWSLCQLQICFFGIQYYLTTLAQIHHHKNEHKNTIGDYFFHHFLFWLTMKAKQIIWPAFGCPITRPKADQNIQLVSVANLFAMN